MKKSFLLLAASLTFSLTAFAGDVSKYSFEVKSPATAQKAVKVAVPVTIKGKGDYHFNSDYPFAVKLTAPAGVKLDKDTIKVADTQKFTKDLAAFEIVFTSADAGKKTFTGEAKFAVCTDKDCAPQTQAISFTVDVK